MTIVKKKNVIFITGVKSYCKPNCLFEIRYPAFVNVEVTEGVNPLFNVIILFNTRCARKEYKEFIAHKIPSLLQLMFN